MTELKVFNTASGKLELFVPHQGKKVRWYTCGLTTYDYAHPGHARMAVVWDAAQRYLRFQGYDVEFVRNITDIDDKIIAKAEQLGWTPEQVAREFTFQFWTDMRALNVMPPDHEPRATEFIGGMIGIIGKLIESGNAYAAGGDVYFDVSSFNGTRLTRQNLDDQKVGARSQVRDQSELKDRKRHPADFALWKGVREAEIGWNSPFGRGRPGWHIECSAMIKEVLGETIDIHSGGEDLIFPHHQNEILQSEALHHHPLAKYWLHNSFVTIGKEKMAKSLGNAKTIRDLLKSHSGDVLRLYLLQTHYRSPIDFSIEGLNATKVGMHRLIRALRTAAPVAEGTLTADEAILEESRLQFTTHMNDDFNTAAAIATLYGLADKIAQSKDQNIRFSYGQALKQLTAVLGMTMADKSHELNADQSTATVDLLLELRRIAREKKDFATSDLIRNRLKAMGIQVNDLAQNSSEWEAV